MFAIDKNQHRLTVAVAAGVLSALLGWIYLHHLENSFQESGEVSQVLIASRYLAKGTILRAGLLQAVRVPKSSIQPGAVTAFDVLESSPDAPRFRTAIAFLADSQLIQSALVPVSAGVGLSREIPNDRVAVSFALDPAHGVGGNIRPGDLVNILHTTKEDPMKPGESRRTATLFQAVPILAVNKNWKIEDSETAGTVESGQKAGDAEEERTVLTVSLNPLAAVELAQARENETLSVVLRAQGDDKIWEKLP